MIKPEVKKSKMAAADAKIVIIGSMTAILDFPLPVSSHSDVLSSTVL
jgi:hypothetical protein